MIIDSQGRPSAKFRYRTASGSDRIPTLNFSRPKKTHPQVEGQHPVATARGSVTIGALFADIVRLANFATNAVHE